MRHRSEVRIFGKPYRPALSVAMTLFAIASLQPIATADGPAVPNRIKYGKPQQIGIVADPQINESSGLASSILYEQAFWTHNDSGDEPRLFLIGRTGNTRAVITLEGVTAIDWEDMASFRREDSGYLLIADVGDNEARREVYKLYVVPEPEITLGSESASVKVRPSLVIPFMYEDGPRDCESVGVDATTGTIYLVGKKRKIKCGVYELPMPAGPVEQPLTARRIATLRIPTTTAMDISPDGLRAVVLTYAHAREYVRKPDESWSKATANGEQIIFMPGRLQGESICYGPDGVTLYLTSEGESQPLWEIREKKGK